MCSNTGIYYEQIRSFGSCYSLLQQLLVNFFLGQFSIQSNLDVGKWERAFFLFFFETLFFLLGKVKTKPYSVQYCTVQLDQSPLSFLWIYCLISYMAILKVCIENAVLYVHCIGLIIRYKITYSRYLQCAQYTQ